MSVAPAARPPFSSNQVYERTGTVEEICADLSWLIGFASKHQVYFLLFLVGCVMCPIFGIASLGAFGRQPEVGVPLLLFWVAVWIFVIVLTVRSVARSRLTPTVRDVAQLVRGLAIPPGAPLTVRIAFAKAFEFKGKRYLSEPNYLTIEGPLPSGARFHCELTNKTWSTSQRIGPRTTRITTYFVQSIAVEIRFVVGRYPHVEVLGGNIAQQLKVFPLLGGQISVKNGGGVLGVRGDAQGLSAAAAIPWIASLHAELDPTNIRVACEPGKELAPPPPTLELLGDDFKVVRRNIIPIGLGFAALFSVLSLLGVIGQVRRYADYSNQVNRSRELDPKGHAERVARGYDFATDRAADAQTWALYDTTFLCISLGGLAALLVLRKKRAAAAAAAAVAAAAGAGPAVAAGGKTP